jgi:Flp pilus assembly protein TadB
MNHLILPLSVRVDSLRRRRRQRTELMLRRTWDERADESGLDEAVTRMVWLAVAVTVAIAATSFFIGVFNAAKAGVPDPVAPRP